MLCGIVFVGFIIAAVISAPGLPSTDASTVDYAASLAAHANGHITSTLMSGLASLAFFVFLTGLSTAIRSAESGTNRLSQLVFGSGVAAVLMILVAQAVCNYCQGGRHRAGSCARF